MRYVVTGGAGFLGSNIVAELEARGAGQIVVVDAMDASPDQWLNIAQRSLHGLVSPGELWRCLEDCPAETALIHMAARSSTTDTDADALIETNAMLTARLFEYCALRKWRFVYASSASVYGAGSRQSDDDAAMAGLKPLNPYAWSKALADKMVASRASGALGSRAPPLWAGLRFFNVYGPGEAHKGAQRSFVSQCFDSIHAHVPIRLFSGSENFRRDWVYSGDCARLAVDLIMAHSDLDCGSVYNVGAGAATSFVDAAAICIEAAGRVTPIATVQFPRELRGRYQSYTRADTAKLLALLPGFQFFGLREGAAHYWREHASRDWAARYP